MLHMKASKQPYGLQISTCCWRIAHGNAWQVYFSFVWHQPLIFGSVLCRNKMRSKPTIMDVGQLGFAHSSLHPTTVSLCSTPATLQMPTSKVLGRRLQQWLGTCLTRWRNEGNAVEGLACLQKHPRFVAVH